MHPGQEFDRLDWVGRVKSEDSSDPLKQFSTLCDVFQSTVCERIMEAVVEQNNGHERQIISLSQDSFYRELDDAEGVQAAKGTFNFDHPGQYRVVHLVAGHCLLTSS